MFRVNIDAPTNVKNTPVTNISKKDYSFLQTRVRLASFYRDTRVDIRYSFKQNGTAYLIYFQFLIKLADLYGLLYLCSLFFLIFTEMDEIPVPLYSLLFSY